MPEHDAEKESTIPCVISFAFLSPLFQSLGSMLLALAFMFSICSMQSQMPLATGPPEMSLVVHEDETAAISPAMVAFFRGNRAPVAANSSTVPKWRRPAPELQQEGNGMGRTIILVAGIVCGAVAIGLLVTAMAMMAFATHARKSRREVRLGAV